MSEESARAPLLEHLTELKRCLIIAGVALLAGVVVSYVFAEPIYQFLLQPLVDTLPDAAHRRMIYTGLTEAFFTYIKLAFFGGFMVALPVLLFQIYKFVSPGLYRQEKQVFLPFLFAAPVLFFVGAALAYYMVLPMAWKFLLGFETAGGAGTLPIQLEARVSEYLSLVMHIILAFGVAFQMPVLLTLLVKVGVIDIDMLKRSRRYAIVAVFVFAAIITPPDIISQIMLAVPLLVLYELSIFACGKLKRDDD